MFLSICYIRRFCLCYDIPVSHGILNKNVPNRMRSREKTAFPIEYEKVCLPSVCERLDTNQSIPNRPDIGRLLLQAYPS